MSNRVTLEQINALLDNAIAEESVLHSKDTVVSFMMPDRGNFTVTGRASVVDPANFDINKGREVARQRAADQLWQLEGYLLQLERAGVIQFCNKDA